MNRSVEQNSPKLPYLVLSIDYQRPTDKSMQRTVCPTNSYRATLEKAIHKEPKWMKNINSIPKRALR